MQGEEAHNFVATKKSPFERGTLISLLLLILILLICS